MENPILDAPEIPSGKIYTIRSIWWATFLGSPLAGAYLLSKNNEVLDQKNNVLVIWGVAVALIVLGIGVSFTGFMTSFLPAFLPIVGMNTFAQAQQKTEIERFISLKGQTQSVWTAVGISLFFFAGWLIVLIAIGYFVFGQMPLG